jgi:curved DNA-binding protein CbpA
MAAVNEAWRILSDPGRRALYDASLRIGPGRRAAPEPPGPPWSPGDEGDEPWNPDWLRDPPISEAEARATRRLGVMVVVTVAITAMVLTAMFVYAFIRSGSLQP